MIRKAALAVSSLAFAGLLALSPARAEAQQTVTCSSNGYERAYCSVHTSGGVRLVRQLSDAECVNGRSYGTDRRGIWVSRGCRAQFQVGYRNGQQGQWGGRDGRYDDRYDDRYDRYDNRAQQARANQAIRVCRRAVADRYRNVRNSDVDVSYRATDRYGNSVVRWSVGRAGGSCTVNSAGRILDLNVARR